MKFTKEQAFEILRSNLTNGGKKTLRMSEKSINAQLDTLIPLVANANHEGWYFTEAALNNAVKLAKILMKEYNIPVERVVRHYDITGKLCPALVGWNDHYMVNNNGTIKIRKNNSEQWQAFKARLK